MLDGICASAGLKRPGNDARNSVSRPQAGGVRKGPEKTAFFFSYRIARASLTGTRPKVNIYGLTPCASTRGSHIRTARSPHMCRHGRTTFLVFRVSSRRNLLQYIRCQVNDGVGLVLRRDLKCLTTTMDGFIAPRADNFHLGYYYIMIE